MMSTITQTTYECYHIASSIGILITAYTTATLRYQQTHQKPCPASFDQYVLSCSSLIYHASSTPLGTLTDPPSLNTVMYTVKRQKYTMRM